MGSYGGIRARHAQTLRIRQSRQTPAPVAVSFRCSVCGQDHPTADHDLANRRALDAMSADALEYLRGQVIEELVSAVKGGAGLEHLRGVGIVLSAIDRRLDA